MESKSLYDDEVRIKVPLDFIKYPLGFIIDAGGSVMKLLYRAKEDYEDCKSKQVNQLEGELRMRYFPIGHHEQLYSFVKRHVDISKEVGVAKEKLWLHTGICTTFFKKSLEDAFNIKIDMMNEMIAISKLKQLQDWAVCLKPRPPSLQAARYCIEINLQFITCMQAWNDQGDNTLDMFSLGDAKKISEESKEKDVVSELIGLVLKSDEEGIVSQLSKISLSFPCLIVLCGSAFTVIILNENGTFKPCGYLVSGGKTFFALGEELTGAKDFEDLIRMVKAGDSNKVDLKCKDIKSEETDSDNNWYTPMPDNFVVFNMGKLSSHNIGSKKPYSKEDIAAGFLNMWCEQLAQWSLLNARLQKVKDIVFCGSFIQNELVKECVERYSLSFAVLNAFEEKRYIHSHFLSNPGFLCALGVWCQSVEDMNKDL